MRFSIYNHSFLLKNNEICEKQVIVLKQGKEIVAWTNFHMYIKANKSKISHKINERTNLRTKNVVKLLNYIFFDEFSVSSLSEITVDMIAAFLNDYGTCNLPGDNDRTHRKQSTVDICIVHIMDFITELLRDKKMKCNFREADLYRLEKVWSKRKKTFIERKVPVFNVEVHERFSEKIFRDIPTDAFAIIMNNIYVNHPRIIMLAACSAFAGTRPSESCNIRREDSLLGPGIRIEYLDGRIEKIELDLRYEFNLRSDFKPVGGIKKHRMQQVYFGLIPSFIECYNRYNAYNAGRPYEKEYGALTTVNNGKAMTYQSYYDEFRKAVKESIPTMLCSDNPEVVYYGHLLKTHKISPHILRHWFSVYLVLNGAELNDLMYWRGDKSPDSSQVYIDNKSDLLKKHNQVADAAFDFLSWRAAKWNS